MLVSEDCCVVDDIIQVS